MNTEEEKIINDLDIITKDLFENAKLTGEFIYWLPESLVKRLQNDN